MTLTAKERAFCQHFAAGANATEAARRAGYSDKGSAASVAANRLLKRADVVAEIRRLRDKVEDIQPDDSDGPDVKSGGENDKGVKSGAKSERTRNVKPGKAVSRIVMPPREAIAQAKARAAIGLTREFIEETLVEATAMARGLLPMPRTLIIRPRPTEKDPNPQPVFIDAAVLEADPKAAAMCASLCAKEMDRLDALKPGGVDGAVVEGEVVTPLSEFMTALREARGLPPVDPDYDPTKEASYP
jgi:hypothetical protein